MLVTRSMQILESLQKAEFSNVGIEGNPYRVEIQNDEKSNVWVPIDNDHFVE